MTSIIALHGATGGQGQHISTALTAAGYRIRPLTSRTADLSDPGSLTAAYTGADAVVVQLPLLFEPAVLTYAGNILTALRGAGVRKVVFNPATALPPEPVGVPFVDARVLLAERLPEVVPGAALVGPATVYLENLVQPWSVRRIAEQGEVAYPLPAEAPVPWLATGDLGAAVAAALAAGTTEPVRYLRGPEDLTGDQVAAAIGAAAGRAVRWVPVSPDEYRELLTPELGAAAAAGVAAAYATPAPPLPVDRTVAATTGVREWAGRHRWTTS